MTDNWIYKEQGCDRTQLLCLKLDEKQTQQSNSNFFLPWNSDPDLNRFFSDAPPLLSVPSIDHHNFKIITTTEELIYLDGKLTKENNPLGVLNPLNSNKRVERPNSDRLQIFIDQHRKFEKQIAPYLPAYFLKNLLFFTRMIIPLGFTDPNIGPTPSGGGLSNARFRKALFLGPVSENHGGFLRYAINLAHEVGHQMLFTYQSADAIIEGDPLEPVYSPIRQTLRPAIQVMHALVAAVKIQEMLNHFPPAMEKFRANETASLKVQVQKALVDFQKLKFTNLGKFILSDVRSCFELS